VILQLLKTFIIPAVESATPLPANPRGVARRDAAIEALASP